MAEENLTGKGITVHDVVRQALEPKNLGPLASPAEVQEWAEWKYPMVELPAEDFPAIVEALRGGQVEPAAEDPRP